MSDYTKNPYAKTIRQTGIGGGDIAAILGLSSYKTINDIFLDKVNVPEKEFSRLQLWGLAMEQFIIAEWAKRSKKVYMNTSGFYTSGYKQAHIDGLGVDAKSVSKYKYEMLDGPPESIPPEFGMQGLWYLGVMRKVGWRGDEWVFPISIDETGIRQKMSPPGLRWVDGDPFFLAVPGASTPEATVLEVIVGHLNPLIIKKVYWNAEVFKRIDEIIRDFWEENVVKGIPPNDQQYDIRDIRDIYETEEWKTINNKEELDDVEGIEEIEEIEELSKTVKENQEKIILLRKKIIKKMYENRIKRIEGLTLIFPTNKYVINWEQAYNMAKARLEESEIEEIENKATKKNNRAPYLRLTLK